jgi:hypothetical protein
MLEMWAGTRRELSARFGCASVASVEVLWGAGSASGAADIVVRVTGVSSAVAVTGLGVASVVPASGTAIAVAIDLGMGKWMRGKSNSSVDDSCDAGSHAGADEGSGLCAGRDAGNASTCDSEQL